MLYPFIFIFINLCHAGPLRLNTSYIAQSWRPGAKLGVELVLAETAVEKTRQG